MTNRKKEKAKWFVALLLCVSCLMFCVSMLAPTLADTGDLYISVTGCKNVYEVRNSDTTAKSPPEFVYTTSPTVGSRFATPLKVKDSKYFLPTPDAEFYQIDADGSVETSFRYTAGPDGVFGNADDVKEEGDPAGTGKFKAVTGKENIYEALTAAGESKSPEEFVYCSSDEPEKALPIAAYVKSDVYYIKLTGGNYIAAAAADGTLDCNDVIEKLGAAGETVLFPKAPPPPVSQYKAVEGYKNLFEYLKEDGASKDPREYVYSTKTDPATDTAKQPAYAKNSKYYTERADYKTIYLAIKAADGSLDQTDAIWAGADKKFDSPDDKKAEWRTDAFYYEITSGAWEKIYPDNKPPESTTPKYEAVSGIKNLFEVKKANGDSNTPKQYIYASSATPTQVHNIPAFEKDTRYFIAVYGTETVYCQVKADGTLETAVYYKAGPDNIFPSADDVLVLGDAAGTKKYQAVAGKKNIYEALTDAGVSQEPKKYVYSSSEKPQEVLPIDLYVTNSFYIRLLSDVYIMVNETDGTLDCNNVISAGPDKIFNTADDTVLFPKSTMKYKPVEGCKNLFEVLDANGQSKNPKEYVYSTKADPAQDTALKPAYAKDNKFYTEFAGYPTVYLAVKADGSLDESDAIWAGEDKVFGTADDKVAVRREDNNYYYEVSPGAWQIIPRPSTVQPTDPTSTTNPLFNTDPDKGSLYPDTGEGPKTGLIISLSLLLAACVYFGYRFFRREETA